MRPCAPAAPPPSPAPQPHAPPPPPPPAAPRLTYTRRALRALRHARRALPASDPVATPAPLPLLPTTTACETASGPAFASLRLHPSLLAALAAARLDAASPVQALAVPLGRLGADVIAHAKSGTGKTLAFALVALEALLAPRAPTLAALVLVPARELAAQVASVVRSLARFVQPAPTVHTLVGGVPEAADEHRLHECPELVVGTPGRVEALLRRGCLRAEALRVLVLDEADRLLDGSFGGSVESICAMLPARRQTLAFSATFGDGLRRLLVSVMRDPAYLRLEDEQDCAPSTSVLSSVRQRKVAVHTGAAGLQAKLDVMKRVLLRDRFTFCVVFTNSKTAAPKVVSCLSDAGFAASFINANLPQRMRDDAVQTVRDGSVQVLVATDVVARGIDFDTCDLVVQLDVPQVAATYLHRVGRAGRFGRRGVSVVLYDAAREVADVSILEGLLGYRIEPLTSATPDGSVDSEMARHSCAHAASVPKGTASRRGALRTEPAKQSSQSSDLSTGRAARTSQQVNSSTLAVSRVAQDSDKACPAFADAMETGMSGTQAGDASSMQPKLHLSASTSDKDEDPKSPTVQVETQFAEPKRSREHKVLTPVKKRHRARECLENSVKLSHPIALAGDEPDPSTRNLLQLQHDKCVGSQAPSPRLSTPSGRICPKKRKEQESKPPAGPVHVPVECNNVEERGSDTVNNAFALSSVVDATTGGTALDQVSKSRRARGRDRAGSAEAVDAGQPVTGNAILSASAAQSATESPNDEPRKPDEEEAFATTRARPVVASRDTSSCKVETTTHDAWDTYAQDAYDDGFNEAYAQAFRMAQELKRRLEVAHNSTEEFW